MAHVSMTFVGVYSINKFSGSNCMGHSHSTSYTIHWETFRSKYKYRHTNPMEVLSFDLKYCNLIGVQIFGSRTKLGIGLQPNLPFLTSQATPNYCWQCKWTLGVATGGWSELIQRTRKIFSKQTHTHILSRSHTHKHTLARAHTSPVHMKLGLLATCTVHV